MHTKGIHEVKALDKTNSFEWMQKDRWHPNFDELQAAIKEMDLPFLGVTDFIEQQIKNILEKHSEWEEQKEEHEKRKKR